VVEGGGAEQTDLLLRREQQLDPAVRPVLGEHAPCSLEHRRDCRLVVGSEDRAGRIADHAVVVDHWLDRRSGRHGVEMGTEEDRRAAAVRRFEPAVEIADVRADGAACLILVDRQAEVAEITDDCVGDGALVARRAGQRGQLGEEIDDLRGHRAILVRAT